MDHTVPTSSVSRFGGADHSPYRSVTEPFSFALAANYLFTSQVWKDALRKGLDRFDSIDVRLQHQLHSMALEEGITLGSPYKILRETECALSARYVWACDLR